MTEIINIEDYFDRPLPSSDPLKERGNQNQAKGTMYNDDVDVFMAKGYIIKRTGNTLQFPYSQMKSQDIQEIK